MSKPGAWAAGKPPSAKTEIGANDAPRREYSVTLARQLTSQASTESKDRLAAPQSLKGPLCARGRRRSITQHVPLTFGEKPGGYPPACALFARGARRRLWRHRHESALCDARMLSRNAWHRSGSSQCPGGPFAHLLGVG